MGSVPEELAFYLGGQVSGLALTTWRYSVLLL